MKSNVVKMSCKRGFTLIELLVVVLIIGVLSAVALPQYNKAVKKAQAAEVLNAIDAMDKALASYYLTHGTYAAKPTPIVESEDLDIEMPILKHWLYGNNGDPRISHVFLQTGTSSTGEKTDISFRSNLQELYVNASWEKGILTTISCQENSGTHGKKCDDYFNCSWQEEPSFSCCNPHGCGYNCGTTKQVCYIK